MIQQIAIRGARQGIFRLMPKLSPCLKNQCRPISTGTPATIVDAGFWKSLVPKPLRRENRKRTAKKTKDWNPMTFYIVMFLFIGSMSIQMIALRNQTNRYIRQSSVRIGLLKEIIQRIQNGEDVDVDKILGAGDAQKEADWEEVLLAIEQDNATAQPTSQAAETTSRKEPSEEMVKNQVIETDSQQQKTVDTPNKPQKSAGFGSFF